jgi:hypothetical protein
MSELILSIKKFLTLIKPFQGIKGVKTNSMQAQVATQQLLVVAKNLKKLLPDEMFNNYQLKISKGYGYFPTLPWIALLPNGKKISESISLFICFGNFGKGLVIGAAFPYKIDEGKFKTKIRDEKSQESVKTKIYSDKFVNPAEFIIEDMNEIEIIDHIKASFLLLQEYNQENLIQ